MIYVSSKADPELIAYLENAAEEEGTGGLVLTGPYENVLPGIDCHADLAYCRLSAGADSPVYRGDPEKLSKDYPGDCIYNAAVCGRYIIHKRGVTDPGLLEAAERHIRSLGMEPAFVNVPQGYTKCNIAVIDEGHVISSDRGIFKALEAASDVECLLVSPGQISLPGFDTGFIGGCCGRVGGRIVFSGDLSAHGDFERIRKFIDGCGLETVYFKERPLTDIGSIISGGETV